ncbi:Protein of unknown function [Bacillus cytotoxicus]|uniref:Uncharacterized protein n=1 Tax=Bacillus cytotoxicus TaxID=580165 RepID=A0AAX2CDD5_9BACI|nr:Protein of unknown function [Bacillus cytotoxicus]
MTNYLLSYAIIKSPFTAGAFLILTKYSENVYLFFLFIEKN